MNPNMMYNRLGGYRRSSSTSPSSSSCYRGFRLKPRKLLVQRLRSRVAIFLKVLCLLRSSCCKVLGLLWRERRRRRKRSRARDLERSCSGSQRTILVAKEPYRVRTGDYRYASFDGSNSFYAEAIADCLDFIRRSSVSIDQSSSSP
ncbi:hypothetical protein SAY87_028497 [Trapa incisa]|uniref:Uncharacterized protein n=1 Tax=Trapa incisa TaxID=236973 RepID=A0AAN7QRM7_9MYRT|nr:hypothetical protein SAY87_028497 [Trapa incisa]